jgi:RNA polymerase sigma-70 factor (ECF subfamily)
MEGRSDAELLTRFRRGDDRALDELFERYERSLFLFLLGMLRDHHRAEDALQETFVQALLKQDGVDPGHLRGWLFTVAYHQAMLTRRKLAVQQRHFPRAASSASDRLPDRSPDPAQTAQIGDDADWCRALLQQLPEPQREVVRLRLYEGKRFHEIAAALGCPLNTALARMHQGLRRLRSLGQAQLDSRNSAR